MVPIILSASCTALQPLTLVFPLQILTTMSRTGVGGPNTTPSTTTISTIAVQSGSSRLVLALLQSGPRQAPSLQLRVLEMVPEFGWLGSTIAEAGVLQAGQVKVMTALQDKQSPVEELLRQADQMILTQQPRAEVYSAMAESLGSAWRDINNIMEERRMILDINLAFQGHLQVRFLEEISGRNVDYNFLGLSRPI